MNEYFLAKDAFVCETAGYAVFLDLAKDRYVALPPESVRMLKALVSVPRAFHQAADQSQDGLSSDELASLSAELAGQGLLVTDERQGKRLIQLAFSAPQSSLRIDDSENVEATWGCRARFRLAQVRAAAALNFLTLKSLTQRVGTRKLKRARRSFAAGDRDRNSGRLAYICSGLQSKGFSGRDTCLKDSLTMLEFLAQYDIFPDWFFGVSVHPFAAHCWLQDGSVVLNDSVHNVRRFTPLMVV